ncbi:replication initiation protein RepM [Acinetobacter sp. YH12071]|uniref:replication initiation protein RepM n=1 Tax=Acinetobacter sp. YH12071 TaxID=2601067 RepID=UPI0015D0D85E|nr:replication initiation protein RepM [Acinetobacter sp. YH12071]
MRNSKDLDMSLTVSKLNVLVKAHYKMTLVEHRLFNIALTKIRANNISKDNNIPIIIHAKDYTDLYADTIDGGYKALKNAIDNLFERHFTLERLTDSNVKHVRVYRFIQMKGYFEGEGKLELQFSNDVLPFITQLANRFTQIDLSHTADLKSQYAYRLYELLKEVQNYKEQKLYMDLEDLRSRFGVLDKYKTMSNLKDNVIDLAVNQINESEACDICDLKYINKKSGRKIVGFEFTYKLKRPKKKKDASLKMTDKQRHFFAAKLSELPEMGSYSEGTESYQQFAVRIAEMLQNPEKFKELYPYLQKVGFKAA